MKNKVRLAVLVSGGGTNLQAIIGATESGAIASAEIACVISNNPRAFALERAKRSGIKTYVVDKSAIGAEAFEKRLIEILEAEKIELIALAGFMCILSGDFTSRFPRRILNVHPALIPSFCGKGYYGLKVHEAALMRGVKITGATVHFVNEIADGGEIIAQKPVRVMEGDTPEILQRRVMEEAEWIILPESIEKVSARILAEKGEDIK